MIILMLWNCTSRAQPVDARIALSTVYRTVKLLEDGSVLGTLYRDLELYLVPADADFSFEPCQHENE